MSSVGGSTVDRETAESAVSRLLHTIYYDGLVVAVGNGGRPGNTDRCIPVAAIRAGATEADVHQALGAVILVAPEEQKVHTRQPVGKY